MTRAAMLATFGLALLCGAAQAAPPADAPAGTTGLCKDGTYYAGPTKQGACKGHKGVKEWYGAAAPAPANAAGAATAPAPKAQAPAAQAPAAQAPAAAAPVTKPAPAAAAPKADKGPATQTAAAAPGGGAGKVWVNKGTKVYHCPGDRWYGKTKEGEYMAEADAKAQGFQPDHGKPCK